MKWKKERKIDIEGKKTVRTILLFITEATHCRKVLRKSFVEKFDTIERIVSEGVEKKRVKSLPVHFIRFYSNTHS